MAVVAIVACIVMKIRNQQSPQTVAEADDKNGKPMDESNMGLQGTTGSSS